MLQKVLRAAWLSVRLACHAAASPRLVIRRYLLRQPVVGSIPCEMRFHDSYWEKRLRVDTAGWAPVTLADGKLYEGTPYLLLFAMIRQLELGPGDKLVDLGCGKGRVVAMVALSDAGCVAGVEQDETFLEAARENLARVPQIKGKVQLFHGLAQQFDFDDTTVVFMFNPFGADTMQEVLDRLRSSLQRKPRRLRIVYVNPVHEHVLGAATWLQNTSTWPSSAYPDHAFQPPNPRMVSFWEARPAGIRS